MKKASFTFTILIFFCFCRLGAQQNSLLPAIDKVVVSNGIMLQIERTPGYRLQMKFQEIDSTCLIKTVKDGTLTLKINKGSDCKGKVFATLECPGLKEIESSGKAEVSTKNLITGDSLKLVLKTNGQAYIDMDVKYLKADLTEGGMLSAEGYAVKQDISVSTSSTFSGYKLEGDKVNVKVTFGGKAKICVAEELNATTGSSGYISYKCNPKKKTIDSEAGGSVEESKE